MTLRCNPRRRSRQASLLVLARACRDGEPTQLSEFGIVLKAPVAPQQLPEFSDGGFSVQDEAAQLAAPLLAPQPGEYVLDACAAPGGKTCHLLEIEPSLSGLLAIDIDAARLVKISENLARCGLSARLQQADIAAPGSWWDGKPFDAILADLPCSATGVIRRHPDIKLLRTPEQLGLAAQTQFELLRSLWGCLAPGGRLLYCTCSIMRCENDAVLSRFLSATPDARSRHLDVPWGITTRYGRQLLPQIGGHDGFYYAQLDKVAGQVGPATAKLSDGRALQ